MRVAPRLDSIGLKRLDYRFEKMGVVGQIDIDYMYTITCLCNTCTIFKVYFLSIDPVVTTECGQ